MNRRQAELKRLQEEEAALLEAQAKAEEAAFREDPVVVHDLVAKRATAERDRAARILERSSSGHNTEPTSSQDDLESSEIS